MEGKSFLPPPPPPLKFKLRRPNFYCFHPVKNPPWKNRVNATGQYSLNCIHIFIFLFQFLGLYLSIMGKISPAACFLMLTNLNILFIFKHFFQSYLVERISTNQRKCYNSCKYILILIEKYSFRCLILWVPFWTIPTYLSQRPGQQNW